MVLRAGRLRHRVQVQENKPTQNTTTGAMKDNWVTVTGCEAVPCAIEPLSAREFLAAQAVQSKVTTRITIRYRSDMKASYRLYHAAKKVYYDVSAFLPDKNSGLEYMTALCASGVKVAE